MYRGKVFLKAPPKRAEGSVFAFCSGFKIGKRFAFRFLMVLKIKFRRKFKRTAEFCGRSNHA
jgi:hypothetical protein